MIHARRRFRSRRRGRPSRAASCTVDQNVEPAQRAHALFHCRLDRARHFEVDEEGRPQGLSFVVEAWSGIEDPEARAHYVGDDVYRARTPTAITTTPTSRPVPGYRSADSSAARLGLVPTQGSPVSSQRRAPTNISASQPASMSRPWVLIRARQDTARLLELSVHTCTLEFDLAPGLPAIEGGESQIRQIIMNLLDNSMKYTPKGMITVVAHDDVKKKKMYITIQDTGVGMSKETQEEVFEKFVRAKNANNVNVTGTGLGLFVAKKMLTDMGGKVTAESEGEGKGSRFIIEFPLLTGPAVQK